MYYGNQNPFEKDSYRALMSKDARKAFSRFHLGLCAYILVASVATIVIDLLLLLFLGNTYVDFTEGALYPWIMGTLPMYLIGLPTLYIIVASMPKKRFTKTKMSLGEFLSLFAIAQFFMLIGNTAGNTLNEFFASLKGDEITNSTSELIENSPIWLTLIIAVIIGPIIEELIFRKLMLERLSRYGSTLAIIVSGISFGLFHGNFYQFFYAALLGILLSYITVKTGNWLYSVLMHVIINFFGSVAVIPVLEKIEDFMAATEAMEAGEAFDMRSFAFGGMAMLSYMIFTYGIAIAGLFLLIWGFRNKRFKIKNDREVNLPREDAATAVIFNVGTIAFILLSFANFALNIFLT